jgi:ketosteroid isomerase-like protein
MTDDNELSTKLQQLLDRNEILECLHRYARGMDRQDREVVRSVYHDDAIDVHGSIPAPVEQFLDWAFAYHDEQRLHQHYITNDLIELDGDTAHSETYYLFVGRYPDPDTPLIMAGGRYVDRFERRNGQWAIARRVCTAEWRTNPPSRLADVGAANVVPPVIVSRDRDDVSYRRPLIVDLAPD